MIGFPTDFAAELVKRASFPFWTAVFHFPQPRGDVYVTQYPATIAGQKHELIITGLSAIGPLTDRKEPKIKLDVNRVGFNFLNQPGATSTGERFSAYFPSTLEYVLADIYLTFRLSDGSFVQPASPLYSAVAQGAAQYGYDVGSLDLYSLSEKYLNAPALRLVDSTAFPYAPAGELGKAIPVAHGNVTRSPGRIVRQTAKVASAPKPAATNIGTGILASVVANATAVSEAWTLTMNSPATVAQTSQNGEWTPGLGGAIAFDASSSASTAASGATFSWTHTCTGNRRLLFVYVATRITAIASVTYGGKALTNLSSVSGDRESVWYLIDPPAGANTVVITPALTGYAVEGAALSYTEATYLQSIYSYAAHSRAGVLSDGVTFSDPGASSAYGLADTDFLCDGILVRSTGAALTSGPTPQAPQTGRTNTVQSNIYHNTSTLNSNTGSLGKGKMAWNWSGDAAFLTDHTVGVRVSRRWGARARSFVMPSTQTLGSVQIWCRQDPDCAISGSGRYASVAIYTDLGGAPGTLLTSGTAVPTTTAGYLTIPVPNVSLANAATYWLVVSTVFDIHGVAGVIYGFTDASGTYAIGRMSDQLNSWVTVSTGNVGDIRFQLQFVAGQYTVTGSVTDADGTGNTNADFTSTSGRLTIKAAAWSGSPTGGDIWTWTASAGSPTVIFSDSPQATPISALGNVYYAGLAISGATIAQLVDNDVPCSVGKATDQFGVKHAESVVINSPTLLHDTRLRIAKVGAPTAPLTLELRIDSSGQPTGNVVASAQVAAASVPVTPPTLYSFTFSPTVVLAPGTYWILGDSTQSDDLNYYQLMRSNTDTYAAGTHMSWDKTAQKWVTVASKDLVFQVTAATITKSTSALDDAGVYAAFATFDVDIGSGVTVEADVTGIKDDTSGTYTGTASALIQLPPDVIYWWLAVRAGVPKANIDVAGSFNATKAALNSLYQFNGVLQDAMSIKAALLRFCFESRCLFDWSSSLAQFKYLKSAPPPSAEVTVTLYDLILASSGVPDITIQRIPIDEVVNSIDAQWSRLAYTTSYANLWHQEDSASVAAFGALKRDKYFQYDFLTSLAAVRDNLSYQLARNASPAKRRVFIRVPLSFLAAEKEDTMALNLVNTRGGGAFPLDLTQLGNLGARMGAFPIDLTLAQNLAETLDHLDGGQLFSIEAKQINAENMSISFIAREY